MERRAADALSTNCTSLKAHILKSHILKISIERGLSGHGDEVHLEPPHERCKSHLGGHFHGRLPSHFSNLQKRMQVSQCSRRFSGKMLQARHAWTSEIISMQDCMPWQWRAPGPSEDHRPAPHPHSRNLAAALRMVSPFTILQMQSELAACSAASLIVPWKGVRCYNSRNGSGSAGGFQYHVSVPVRVPRQLTSASPSAGSTLSGAISSSALALLDACGAALMR